MFDLVTYTTSGRESLMTANLVPIVVAGPCTTSDAVELRIRELVACRLGKLQHLLGRLAGTGLLLLLRCQILKVMSVLPSHAHKFPLMLKPLAK